MEGFRGPQVCRLTGLSYRQIDYWDRIGLACPSITPASGSGSGSLRLYSTGNVVLMKAIHDLLAAGFSLQFIRGEFASGLRDAIDAGRSEYRWQTGPVTHAIDLASLRRQFTPIAA